MLLFFAGIVIDEGSMEEAGAGFADSVPNDTIFVGNPARIIRITNNSSHCQLFENKAYLVEDKIIPMLLYC